MSQRAGPPAIDVMIIAFNEALNLPHCLDPLRGWTRRVFVVDSGSTDGTQEIAAAHGAEVVHHAWIGYARQKNWALDNLPFESPWVLILDADEVITPELRAKLVEIAARPPGQVAENGFFINRLTIFLGRPIRHCGYFPSWNIRLIKSGRGRYEDRPVHEHVIIDDPVGYIYEPMLHDDRRGLEHYVAKHNRYSTLEARALWAEMSGEDVDQLQANLSPAARRRRWLKRRVLPYAPLPWLWRFIYMYVLRLGFLDGRAGLEFCKFISVYDYLVAMKLRALRRSARLGIAPLPLAAERAALAVAEGAETVADVRLPAAKGTPRAGPPAPAADRAPALAAPARQAPGFPAHGPRVSVVVLTLNEEINIADCLASCAWCDDLHVLDSGSGDRTAEIATAMGAAVHHHPFESFGAQRNWAIDNIPLKHDWVFHLDADERFTPTLIEAVRRLLEQYPSEAGFYVPNKLMFMGRWLNRSGGYPTYQMRLFHKDRMRFCDYGHGQRELTDGVVGTIDTPYLHYAFIKGLTDWFAKHNRYSTLEALRVLDATAHRWSVSELFGRDRVNRRRAWKEFSYHLPFRPFLRWFYTLFIQGGILEGRAGRTYARMLAIYEQMISLKLRRLQHAATPAEVPEVAAPSAELPAIPLASAPAAATEPAETRS